MSYFDQIWIVKILNQFPAHEQEVIVRNASLLIPSPMVNSDDSTLIFFALAKVPANEQEVFVQNVKFIFGHWDGSWLNGWMVGLLANKSANQREALVLYAKFLISDSMVVEAKRNVINALFALPDNELVKIPANEMDDFVKNLRLLTPQSIQNVDDKLSIIVALAKISAPERDVFMQNVNTLIENTTNDSMKLNAIVKLADVPLDQQIDFIKTYRQSLNVNPDLLKAVVRHQESLVQEPNPKEPTIDEILALGPDVSLPQDLQHLSPQHQEMLKKAVKIRNYYNNNGYVCFLHGQEPNRLILQLLIKEIAKIRNPEKHFKDPFVYFRSEKYYEQTAQQTGNVAEQLKKTIVNDNQQRDEVMSVDAYFANISRGESANYWCEKAGSVNSLSSKGATDFDPLLEGIPSGASFAIKQKIVDLMKLFSREAPCGNLYVVAIPSGKAMNYSYPAKPFGKYCDCRSDKETFQQLVEANKGKAPTCKNGATTQWRLATSALRAENGVRSFAITRYDDLKPLIEEYIQPLAAQIVLAQNRSTKRTSHL
jgi:hypothetical protein